MTSWLSIIALGFFLGMRHATDPDHVIAVSTIVSRQRSLGKSALVGVFWGVGHTLTILLVGTAIILFNLVIPPRIGLSMELAVALMLILLGILNILSFYRDLRSSARSSTSVSITHAWAHRLDDRLARVGFYQYVRPLVVGLVHGLAGSAAVALLVLTAIRNTRWAIAYLAIFGVGTIAGMMLITLSIASAFRVVTRGKNQKFARTLAMASGLLSLVFGLVVAYQIGYVGGLFTGRPQWTPR